MYQQGENHMAANIQAPKGTKDILPKNSGTWQLVEDVMRDEASIHGFEEIRTPVFERTELFRTFCWRYNRCCPERDVYFFGQR